jgi:murein L,D-transpeptidase YcbB/YkuD
MAILAIVLIGWDGRHLVRAQTLSAQVSAYLWERLQAAGTPSGPRLAGDRMRSEDLLSHFYTRRLYWPAWSNDAGLLPQVESFLQALHDAEQEGLRMQDYPLTRLESLLAETRRQQATGTLPDAAMLADVDLLLTEVLLTYGTHLLYGQGQMRRAKTSAERGQEQVDLVGVLQQGLESNRVAEALYSLLPQHAGYARLRQALARYRHIAASGGWPTIPTGAPLRPGERSARVETLRVRLRLTGDLDAHPGSDATLYDEAMQHAVRAFQRRHGLDADGSVGPRTLSALNVPAEVRVRQIMQTMERWRWLPQDLGQRYILVDVPAFTLEVVERDQPVMTMRVVVGKPSWPTPVLSSTVVSIVFNPDWRVPSSIAAQEFLPIFRANPGYLAQHNMQVSYGPHAVDPSSIDWFAVSATHFPYSLRQEPGPTNPLGNLKFLFPNRFQVYLHDTPSRGLFTKPERAFSHGCIRLEKPAELAAYVLRGSWTPQHIHAGLRQRTSRTVPLAEPLPIHLVYRTAWVQDDGIVHFRPDIYGYDDR